MSRPVPHRPPLWLAEVSRTARAARAAGTLPPPAPAARAGGCAGPLIFDDALGLWRHLHDGTPCTSTTTAETAFTTFGGSE